jgi:AraC-like DNA-binding protein
MGKRQAASAIAPQRSTFEPLVELLQQELTIAGISYPRSRARTAAQFTRYYLDVVQLLEAHVAANDDHPPMSRADVELMCRCALSGRTLAEAIELCVQFCGAIDPRAGRPALRVKGEVATFTFNSLRGSTSAAASLVDVTGLIAFHQLFQWLVGVDIPLQQVGIGPIAREDVLAFLKLFRAPVLAGGDDYTLTFSAGALVLPVVRRSSEFAAFFPVFPCGVFELTGSALPEQVLALLHASVRQGEGLPSQQELARGLDIPLSTFRRRLRGARVSFRALREQCLRLAAEEMLLRRTVSIDTIAAQLGFSDAPAFRRAFRQWAGISPSAWRESAHIECD